MARGVNKAIILGNLGQDPDVRSTNNGASVANITVATSESWTDKNTGQKVEKTEWHRVVFFGRLAEIVGEYLRKGSQVYIEGKLQTRKWQDKNGLDRYTTEIVGNEMQMLGSKSGGGQRGYAGAPAAPQTNSQGGQMPPQTAPAPSAPMDDFDDDIPF